MSVPEAVREKSREIAALCHEKGVDPHTLSVDKYRKLGGKCTNAHWGQAAAMARRAWDQGLATPDGLYLRKATIKVGDDWLKFDLDKKAKHEAILKAFERLSDKVPIRQGKVAAPRKPASADLLAVYPVGDPHIGMLSWAPETGENWDLKIAEQVFGAAFDDLTQRGDRTECAWLINLGDFFHSDDDTNRTRRSGHHLDVDGRWSRVVDVGVDIMIRAIDACLRAHQKVRVTNVIGNHDDMSSRWLAKCLRLHFRNEPRVTIDPSNSDYTFYRFGNNLFGAHHGHQVSARDLGEIMANEEGGKEHWSDTDYHEWFIGHIHHMRSQEFRGCIVGHYRTLAARDAYAASKGYKSHRDLNRIVYHREGNVDSLERTTAERVIRSLREAA